MPQGYAILNHPWLFPTIQAYSYLPPKGGEVFIFPDCPAYLKKNLAALPQREGTGDWKVGWNLPCRQG